MLRRPRWFLGQLIFRCRTRDTEEWKKRGMLYVYLKYSSRRIINTRVYALYGSSSHILDHNSWSIRMKRRMLDCLEAVPDTPKYIPGDSILCGAYFSSTCSSCPATLDFSWISPARLSRSAFRFAV